MEFFFLFLVFDEIGLLMKLIDVCLLLKLIGNVY